MSLFAVEKDLVKDLVPNSCIRNPAIIVSVRGYNSKGVYLCLLLSFSSLHLFFSLSVCHFAKAPEPRAQTSLRPSNPARRRPTIDAPHKQWPLVISKFRNPRSFHISPGTPFLFLFLSSFPSYNHTYRSLY